jgi:hypothetical protein
MPCCGQGRGAAPAPVRQPTARAQPPKQTARPVAPAAAEAPAPRRPSPTARSVAAAPPPRLPDTATVDVRYLARVPLRVMGARTGRVYSFTSDAPLRAVAREDALVLLGSPSFRRA